MKLNLKNVFAFLTKQNGEGKSVVKENEANGEVTFTAADAAHLETLATDLEASEQNLATANESLETANTALTTAQNSLATVNANFKTVATALGVNANASVDEVVNAIATLKKLPGSSGAENADPKQIEGAGAEDINPFAHIDAQKKKDLEGWN